MIPQTSEMNFWVCSIISVVSIYLAFELHQNRTGPTRYVLWAYTCWVCAWLDWSFLWGIQWLWGPEFDGKRILVLSLSDLNTVFLLLLCFGLIRGRKFKIPNYLLYGITITATAGLLVVVLYRIAPNPHVRLELHGLTSVAWGMFSPVAVGWAVRLRFNSKIPLVTGLLYAITQPPAFLVIVGKGLGDPELDAAVLIVLALLKVVWATSVFAFLGLTPSKTHQLEVVAIPHPRLSGLSRHWKTAIGVFGGLGLLVVATSAYGIQVEGGKIALVTAVLTLLGAALQMLLHLPGRWTRRRHDEEGP